MALNKFDTVDYILANGQRPFRFSISITLPQKIASLTGSLYNQNFNVLAKNITPPSTIIDTVDFGIDGRKITLPITKQLNNTISITFLVDEKHSVVSTLEYWMVCIDSLNVNSMQGPSLVASGVANVVGKVADAAVNIISNAVSSIPIVGKGINSVLGLSDGIKTEDICGTLKIEYQNYSGNTVQTLVLNNVYPRQIQPSELNNNNTTEISEVTVTFVYTDFSMTPKNGVIDTLTGMIGL